MALWRISNNHYYGDREKTKYPRSVVKRIKKPWVAVYLGPDYHDGKQVGRFKTWNEALRYAELGGTPFVLDGTTIYER